MLCAGAHLGNYVYLLVDPRDGVIFYVGKGSGDRVLDHEREALAGGKGCNDKKCDRIRAIHASGHEVKKLILRHGLNRDEALMLESAVIDLLSLPALCNKVDGHDPEDCGLKSLDELMEKYTCGDVDVDNLRDNLVCLNVDASLRGKDLYERIHTGWPAAKEEADKADYVLAEHNCVVIGVFKPDGKGWYAVAPEPGKEEKKRNWNCFDGIEVTDAEILDRYLYKRLPAKAKGAANSFRYFYKND